MCGIAGAVNLPEIKKAREVLTHRGPDSFGVYEQENICLVHRRLAIVDLSEGGHQPMFYKDLIITFNGEIYNFQAIKQELISNGYSFDSNSDTEVIIKAFDCWGNKCLLKFNGMFAFCIYNTSTRSFFIARDKIGIKPLYYYHKDDIFAFGSELKVFPNTILARKNEKALLQFLVLGYITAPASAYENVFKLEPGSYLEYKDAQLRITKYWSPIDKSTHQHYHITRYENALDTVEQVLQRAVKMQMVADVNVGCFLSGGIDSSLIAALAQKNSKTPIKTYAMAFKEKGFDESGYAREVAKHLKTDHHTLTFSPDDLLELVNDFDYYFDEPFGDFASLPLSILCKKAREHGITVALSGDGGDELFLGYERYSFATRYYHLFKNQPKLMRQLLVEGLKLSKNEKALKMVYPISNPSLLNFYQVYATSLKPWDIGQAIDKDFLREIYGKEDINIQDILDIAPDFKIENEKDLSNIDILWNLPDEMLTKSDRASMRFSLELRVPLLDANLMEISRAIPNDLLLKGGVKKSILKDILAKHVPKQLFDRPKRGFSVPMSLWFRNQLKSELMDLTQGLPDFIQKGYVNQLVHEHLNLGRNHSYTLWNLMRIKKFYSLSPQKKELQLEY
ncbi:asparagine synthase (glutamine-hydrolyzing) [Pedobacter immunditicola]|uniref:asparagine synthase (glutamine-hydrolyzing) n=1 Tax=Pedobacter immunditicola TaxID=3133440 RepID=UPI0030B2E50C